MNAESTEFETEPLPRSHLSLFCEVQELARHIVDLTVAVQAECKPGAAPAHKCYAAIAYRWGHSNEHHYFVYIGTDQVKAVTLAENEPSERGGKYGCAVYEFDAEGSEYELIFYVPSVAEDKEANQPIHNCRLDYYERLGMFVDTAYEGNVWLPDPDKPEFGTITKVEIPGFLREEVARMRELLRAAEQGAAQSLEQWKAEP